MSSKGKPPIVISRFRDLSKLLWGIGFSLLSLSLVYAAPKFISATPAGNAKYDINGVALCVTAKHTLAYINHGAAYDPLVIHSGHVLPIDIRRIKATLMFICQHQTQLNDPQFLRQHFEFIHWLPDTEHAKHFSANKPLLKNQPHDRVLMTKYYVHLAKASTVPTARTPYALYALPADEQNLTFEQANLRPDLIRFQYGKQAILAGALNGKAVPKLAYLNRDDLESALLQGTLVADFGNEMGRKIFNVHRSNNIPYDRLKPPYAQERYWYFKQVDGIKGYGKDSDHKITVNPEVTFAADLAQFGLGKLLMIQYPDQSGMLISKAGILADTGGAFADNLYQVDYLAGVYQGKEAYFHATRHLPDYVDAYFMILKQ